MKSTILGYVGANNVVTDDGNVVKLSVNSPHPKAGAALEYDESQIVDEATDEQIANAKTAAKAEADAKALAAKQKADAKAAAKANTKAYAKANADAEAKAKADAEAKK